MKKNTLLYYCLPGLLLLLLSGACVKNIPQYTNFNDIHPIAEIYQGGPTINNAYIALQATPTDYTIDVNLASPDPASKAIQVSLALDTADFNTMNANAGGMYTLLPAAAYTVANWKVTIPAGQHLASLHVAINSTLLDTTQSYILPVMITDASGVTVSGNFYYGFWKVAQGNPWVGLYHSVGYKLDVGVVTKIDQDKYLYFADPNPALGLGYSGRNTVIGQAGDDVTYIDYGIGMDLTVDPVSDTVAVSSDLNQGARGKIALFNNGTCVYDPSKRTFTLNYAYVNAYGNVDSLHEVLTWKVLPQ